MYVEFRDCGTVGSKAKQTSRRARYSKKRKEVDLVPEMILVRRNDRGTGTPPRYDAEPP